MEQLQYPVGRFEIPLAAIPAEDRERLIVSLAALPGKLREAVKGAGDEVLDTPYRPGGWTARQTVHHVADSHMNGYIRCKFALTEDAPVIKPYEEKAWAVSAEAATLAVDPTLTLLDGLHERWAAMFRSVKDADFGRLYRHPEAGAVRLDAALSLYEWHGRHHLAHVLRVTRP